MALNVYLYDADGRDRKITLAIDTIASLPENALVWIDVDERDPKALAKLAAILKINSDAFEAKAKEEERPTLVKCDGYFSFSVDTAPAHVASDEVDTEIQPEAEQGRRRGVPGSVRLDFVVGSNWLVTVHHGPVPSLRRFREQDQAETTMGLLTAQALAASLLDWHLGDYFIEVSRIEEAVDHLDERILREKSNAGLLGRMVALRRRVSKLRALLVAQRDIFYGLSRPDFALITDAGAAPFYEALANRFERAVDEVEHTRDVVVGSFDLFTSRTGQETNDLVKALTFLTAVIGFCAAVAGLMGMNFKAPFFESGLAGFMIVTGGLFAAGLVAIVVARKRGWI